MVVKNKILSLVLIAFTCNSCMTVKRLSNNDISWINMYHVNDTIIFYGKEQISDTLVIRECSIDSIDTSIPMNENYVFSDFYCGCSISGEFLHKSEKQEISFYVAKDEDEMLNFSLFVGEKYIENKKLQVDSFMDNQEYVLFEFENNTDSTNKDVSFLRIKWTKNKGITEYRLSDGHIYISQ
ncbi:MAG: hypothetical protein IIT65_04085 [Lachnospiraceae bacterium]|jgi:hypothetical protein|nr:hypothetical protein [Lachnospiraceae bacterium]